MGPCRIVAARTHFSSGREKPDFSCSVYRLAAPIRPEDTLGIGGIHERICQVRGLGAHRRSYRHGLLLRVLINGAGARG